MKSTIRAVIILIIAIAINIALKDVYAVIDLTEDGRFSLSEDSIASINAIEDEPVSITFFSSKDLPQNMVAVDQGVRDVLSQYATIGGEQINIINRYPNSNEEDEKIANEKEIPKLKYNVVEDTGFEVTSGYSAVLIEYQDNQELIPIVTSTSNLEYQITNDIRKLTNPVKKKIGIVKNHTYISQQLLGALLGEEHEVIPVNIGDITNDLDVVIISGINEDLSEDEQRAFDQFVLSGKPVIAFIDGAVINVEDLSLSKNESNLIDMFNSYGVEITNTLAADFDSHDTITYTDQGSQLRKEYPLWVRPDTGINRSHPIASSIRTFTLPWSSELRINNENIEQLISTSNRGYAFNFEELPNVSPETVFQPPVPSLDQIVLGAHINGEISSHLNQGETGSADIVLIGSAHIVQDAFLRSSPANALFIRNTVEFMAGGDSLSELRSKSVIDRPLQLKQSEKFGQKIKSISVGTGTFLLIGVLVAGVKKRRKKQFLSKI